MLDSHNFSSKVEFVERRVGVLLIHGLTGVPAEMKPVERYLAAQGLITEKPLLPGHGGTHKDMLRNGWRQWLKGAREAYLEMSERCDQVIIAGLSMGGLLGAQIAARESGRPPAGIVLMSPIVRYDGSAVSNRLDWLLNFVDIVPPMGTNCYWTEDPPYGLKDERLVRRITRQIEEAKKGGKTDFGSFRTYAGSLRQLQHLVRDTKKQAANVNCPSLILHSVDDTLASPSNAIQIYNWLGCKDKQLIFMKGCDHVMTVDLKRQEVADHIVNFARKVAVEGQQSKPDAGALVNPSLALSEQSIAARTPALRPALLAASSV